MTQRSREETIQQDVKDLHQLGYAQELFRSMGGFSNFAISFSIISILTGAVILYDYGLAWAGTAAVLIGWPLITVFVLAISASMAELASAYPTAGGLYYWASKMKNKNWGWWTAWLNLIGQFAIVAGIDFAAAGFINATILDRITGGVFNTTVLIPGVLTGQLVTMGVILLIQLALNIAGINLVALLNQVSVWWHIVIVAAVVLLIFLTGKPDQSGLNLFQVQPLDQAGGWNNNLGNLGDVLAAGIAIAMWFCGLSSVAAAGRMLFAFSRDDGIPGSGWLKKVSHRYRTPANALTAIVVVSWLFTVAAFIVGTGTAIVIVTAISTIFLYAAYGVVIYLGATTSGWLEHRVWSLGRWSKPIAWIA